MVPDRAWFPLHLHDLARFVRPYHSDLALAQLLSPPDAMSYREHIDQRLVYLREGLSAAKAAPLRSAEVLEGFQQLTQQARALQPAHLVPTHDDPNNKNFLLTGEGFFLLDWDEIGLSDPLRDTGLLLWWYVPQARWAEFFSAYGTAMTEDVRNKVYW